MLGKLTNTLAYYENSQITDKKIFIILGAEAVFLVMCDPSSCEQPRPIEIYALTCLGHSQIAHRRVAHD